MLEIEIITKGIIFKQRVYMSAVIILKVKCMFVKKKFGNPNTTWLPGMLWGARPW
jgi:hypothetical protein